METIFLRDKNVELAAVFISNFVERDTLNIDQPAIRNCFSWDSPLATKRGKGIFPRNAVGDLCRAQRHRSPWAWGQVLLTCASDRLTNRFSIDLSSLYKQSLKKMCTATGKGGHQKHQGWGLLLLSITRKMSWKKDPMSSLALLPTCPPFFPPPHSSCSLISLSFLSPLSLIWLSPYLGRRQLVGATSSRLQRQQIVRSIIHDNLEHSPNFLAETATNNTQTTTNNTQQMQAVYTNSTHIVPIVPQYCWESLIWWADF